MINWNAAWYRHSFTPLTLLCLPLSYLFRFVIAMRRYAYRFGFLKKYSFSVPIIVVGNITVGGTGKTPFVIALSHALKKAGWTPGIVSRGVGGKQQRQPRWVTTASQVQDVGDEAMLFLSQTNCPLVISTDRVVAVTELLSKKSCDIVISDDGLQHYRLERDIEIVMIDGLRRFGNQHLLPAGPLREPVSRLKTVDFIVEQGKDMILKGDKLISLSDFNQTLPLSHFKNKTVHAVAGIGHPERFFQSLRASGLILIEHIFKDHYLYHAADFSWNDNLPIIMTGKDAVKCKEFSNERFWYLPVEADVTSDVMEKIILKLKEKKPCVDSICSY